MKTHSEEPNTAADEFGLIGREKCMEIVWPDESKRPSIRSFEKLKEIRAIPFVKIGKLVWYDPAAVLAALKENHTVRPRFRPRGMVKAAKST